MVQEYLIGSSSSCWQLFEPHSIADAGSSPFSDILYMTIPSIAFCKSSAIRPRIGFAQKHDTQDLLVFDLYAFSKHRRRSPKYSLNRIFSAPLSCRFNTRADMSSLKERAVEEFWSLATVKIVDWLQKVKVRDIAYCIQYTFKAFCIRSLYLIISSAHM